jgi:antitoxin HigA-1
MRRMIRRPTHPGNIIKEDYLLPLSVTIKDMAETLGVSRKTLSKIINEKGNITPDMALRLSRAFDTTPDFWLNLQKNFDLWKAENASQEWKKVKPFPKNRLHDHNSSLKSESYNLS